MGLVGICLVFFFFLNWVFGSSGWRGGHGGGVVVIGLLREEQRSRKRNERERERERER